MSFVKFTSIESFSHAVKSAHRNGVSEVTYAGKIKLHGTNGGVRVTKDNVAAQSRGRDLAIDADNAGFALWVGANNDKWLASFEPFLSHYETVTFFGEWAGKGIQQSDAVTKLSDKYFFVFAIYADNDVFVDPSSIQGLVPELDHLIVLPNLVQPFVIDYTDSAGVNTKVNEINDLVLSVGEKDPFISEIFGIDGIGEGVVYYPYSQVPVDSETYSRLTFKAKSEAHRVNKSSDAAKAVFEIPVTVFEFVAKFATTQRFQQAVTEIGGDIDSKRIGEYLKWVQQDIIKEATEEIAGLGVDWKTVSGPIAKKAVAWFKETYNA